MNGAGSSASLGWKGAGAGSCPGLSSGFGKGGKGHVAGIDLSYWFQKQGRLALHPHAASLI